MKMRVLCYSVAAIALLATAAGATPVLDQSYTAPAAGSGALSSDFPDPGFRRAMTFTVGITGMLSEVDIEVGFGTVNLNLLSTAGGVPTTTVVGTGTFLSASGGWMSFSTSLAVTAGEVLAIEGVCPSSSCGFWQGTSPNTYAGGEDFFMNPALGIPTFTPDEIGSSFHTSLGDHFKTFVDVASVPEPLTLAVFGAGLAGIRRRKQKS